MYKKSLVIAIAVLLGATGVCWGQEGEEASAGGFNLLEQDTLTNNWFGLGDTLEDYGVAISLSLQQIYQINLEKGR